MKEGCGLSMPKQWPALVLALLIQAAGIVWWASAQDRDGYFLAQRVSNLETGLAHEADGQNQMLERLARIEERVNTQLVFLDRIEKQVSIRERDVR